jgi:hypothetical protein
LQAGFWLIPQKLPRKNRILYAILIGVMRKEKEKALKLRLSGKSYSEIKLELGVPKSTLSGWLSRLVLNPRLKKEIESRTHKNSLAGLIKRNKNQTKLAKERATETQKKAGEEIARLSKENLLFIGTALYWAEGYKRPMMRYGRILTSHQVSLTNSDPFLVKCFLKFLREHCEIPLYRIKLGLRIFPHQNESAIKNFWHQQTGIPFENFQKTMRIISRSSLGKKPFNRLENGVAQIIVADTKLYHRIMGYIEKMKHLV